MVKIRVINIYKATHLPEEGWLQGCYICSTITGRTVDHRPPETWEKHKFNVYMCPHCQKLKRDNEELSNEYEIMINAYIDRNFTYRPVDP